VPTWGRLSAVIAATTAAVRAADRITESLTRLPGRSVGEPQNPFALHIRLSSLLENIYPLTAPTQTGRAAVAFKWRPIEGEEMAVLMTAQIPGGTKEMIDGMRPVLDHITSAKGSSSTPESTGNVAWPWSVLAAV